MNAQSPQSRPLSIPHADVLIIGAGPAGLSAARAAASSPRRLRIVIVDENPQIGGQIWRRSAPSWARELIARGREHNIEHLPGIAIVQPCADGSLLGSRIASPIPGRTASPASIRLTFTSLIIATGARELFLPFPGWTLPGVMGAGGLQAMVKAGMHIAGKRIVVAGSGPLLLAVASFVRKHGAIIPAIIEQAPASAINRFAAGLIMHPGKLAQGIALRASLLGVPYWAGSWVTRAEGKGTLQGVTVYRSSAAKDIDIPCDLLACGFGLVPSTQLAAMLGCLIENGSVSIDALQQTGIPNIYCAGEPTGIGGVDVSILEGRIAGHAAAGDRRAAESLFAARLRAWGFAGRLSTAFALRDELKSLPASDTIICRCEDVTFGELRRYATWRDAKLQTRCGMGPCQGRVCGPVAQYLLDMDPADARPPISPVSLDTLASANRTNASPATHAPSVPHETRP